MIKILLYMITNNVYVAKFLSAETFGRWTLCLVMLTTDMNGLSWCVKLFQSWSSCKCSALRSTHVLPLFCCFFPVFMIFIGSVRYLLYFIRQSQRFYLFGFNYNHMCSLIKYICVKSRQNIRVSADPKLYHTIHFREQWLYDIVSIISYSLMLWDTKCISRPSITSIIDWKFLDFHEKF